MIQSNDGGRRECAGSKDGGRMMREGRTEKGTDKEARTNTHTSGSTLTWRADSAGQGWRTREDRTVPTTADGITEIKGYKVSTLARYS